MTTTLQTTIQKMEVDGAGSTVITDVVESPPGTFTRELRVYDDASPGNLVFTVRLSSTVKTAIELTAPAAQF